MKIEINYPKNISLPPPPPRNLSNPLNKLNTTEIIPNPPEKSQTLPKASPSLKKILSPSRKNLNFPGKLPLSKNSITITETISNTQTKSQPLSKKFLISPEKISIPYTLKIFSILPENF